MREGFLYENVSRLDFWARCLRDHVSNLDSLESRKVLHYPSIYQRRLSVIQSDLGSVSDYSYDREYLVPLSRPRNSI